MKHKCFQVDNDKSKVKIVYGLQVHGLIKKTTLNFRILESRSQNQFHMIFGL